MHCGYVFGFCSDTLGLRKLLMSPPRPTPKRTESLGTKGLPMCHTRTHHHTATSSGCGARSHSSFHRSESPNPSRNSCPNSSIICFAFQQANLSILLVCQAVPPLCSQHCAWNTGPRLMLPTSILLQKSTSLSDTSDSRCTSKGVLPNPRQDPQHRSPNLLVPVCANCPCLFPAFSSAYIAFLGKCTNKPLCRISFKCKKPAG